MVYPRFPVYPEDESQPNPSHHLTKLPANNQYYNKSIRISKRFRNKQKDHYQFYNNRSIANEQKTDHYFVIIKIPRKLII